MNNKKFICIPWLNEEEFCDPKVFRTKEEAEAWGKQQVEEWDLLRYDVIDV